MSPIISQCSTNLLLTAARGDRSHLIRYEQLNIQKRNGLVFQKFKEGPLEFDPTYKFDNGTSNYDTSEKNRTPSWTDRILFRGEGIDLATYTSVPQICSSDHKPVLAKFYVAVSKFDHARRDAIMKELYKSESLSRREIQPSIQPIAVSEGNLVDLSSFVPVSTTAIKIVSDRPVPPLPSRSGERRSPRQLLDLLDLEDPFADPTEIAHHVIEEGRSFIDHTI